MRLMIDRGSVIVDYLDRLGRKDSYKAKFDALREAVDNATAIEVVPYGEYKALELRVRELEKRLSDVGSSPFDGGMSQKQYFGETDCKRRAKWECIETGKVYKVWACTVCGQKLLLSSEEKPHYEKYRFCGRCGAKMDRGVSDG